jgi:hypothetical protein
MENVKTAHSPSLLTRARWRIDACSQDWINFSAETMYRKAPAFQPIRSGVIVPSAHPSEATPATAVPKAEEVKRRGCAARMRRILHRDRFMGGGLSFARFDRKDAREFARRYTGRPA